MKFVIIDAKAREVKTIECETLKDAQALVGLVNVDHGSIKRGVGYVVDEYGLFKPIAEQHYFAMAGRLVAGNAVLYGYNELGETIDLDRAPIVFFLASDLKEIERAFANNTCSRPQLSINGEIFWEWPAPPRKDMMREK